jgi:hypothetical protein
LKESAVYLISLYFIDWQDNWSRTFDVVIEGYTIFSNLNVLLEAGGPHSMYRMEAVVQVMDGSISIELARVSGNPIIAGIQIHKTDLSEITEPITQETKRDVTYIPGNLTVSKNGLILSEGLTAKIIGNATQKFTYFNGQKSDLPFHILPDAGACFVDPRPWNVGGWIYASNSEAPKVKDGDLFPGGVGALTFNKDGQLIEYRMILEDTRMNCGGGTTPWGAWVSVPQQVLMDCRRDHGLEVDLIMCVFPCVYRYQEKNMATAPMQLILGKSGRPILPASVARSG